MVLEHALPVGIVRWDSTFRKVLDMRKSHLPSSHRSKSEAASASLTKDDSGFAFSFIPEGDYILRVSGASDVEYEEVANPPGSVPLARTEEHVLQRYGSTDQVLHIGGDLSGVNVAVPELPAKKMQANF